MSNSEFQSPIKHAAVLERDLEYVLLDDLRYLREQVRAESKPRRGPSGGGGNQSDVMIQGIVNRAISALRAAGAAGAAGAAALRAQAEVSAHGSGLGYCGRCESWMRECDPASAVAGTCPPEPHCNACSTALSSYEPGKPSAPSHPEPRTPEAEALRERDAKAACFDEMHADQDCERETGGPSCGMCIAVERALYHAPLPTLTPDAQLMAAKVQAWDYREHWDYCGTGSYDGCIKCVAYDSAVKTIRALAALEAQVKP